jgi:hypothetical protein
MEYIICSRPHVTVIPYKPSTVMINPRRAARPPSLVSNRLSLHPGLGRHFRISPSFLFVSSVPPS